MTDYWNTEVTFTSNGSDPNGFVWSDTPGRAPSAPAAPPRPLDPPPPPSTGRCRSAAGPIGVSGYIITPYIGGTAQTPVDVGDVTTDVVTGLTNGTAYTFTVAATNSTDFGPASPASNVVTPATVPDAPVIGTATAGNDQATVTFSPPDTNGGATITSYTVTATDSTTPSNGGQTQSGAGSPIVVTGLTVGDSYTFTVTATNSAGTGAASSPSNAVVAVAVPGAPVIGTATGGNTQASVAFSPPSSNGDSTITSYTVTATDSTTPSNGGETKSGAGSPIVVTGLTNGDRYTFTVTATNSVGTGAASAASNAVVPATVPDAPVIGTASAGDNEASTTFSPPDSDGGATITSYTVTATDSTNPSNGGETQSGAGSPIVVTGLTNGDSYTFTVTATNSAGTGAASASSNAVVPTTVPNAPTNVAATGGNTQASVTFGPPDNDGGSTITSYTVTATDSTTPSSGGQTQSGAGSPIVVTGLTNGDSYTFTVTATNTDGTGEASAVVQRRGPGDGARRPGHRHGHRRERPGVGGLQPARQRRWGHHHLLHGDGHRLDQSGPRRADPSGAGSPIVVTGLTNGDSYTFTVTATNSAGTGAASSASNSVTPVTKPGAPTSVGVTAGKGSVKVTWKAPSSNGGSAITHYVIKSSAGKSVTVGDVTSDTVTGLTNGTAYTFTVAATSSVGTGAASAKSKSVTPDGLYIVTKTLPKATKGAKYAPLTLTVKNGVGTETWTATGLPTGLKLSSTGKLSGKVKSSDAAKTYSVTITVKDSSTPTKQTASSKLSLVVASSGSRSTAPAVGQLSASSTTSEIPGRCFGTVPASVEAVAIAHPVDGVPEGCHDRTWGAVSSVRRGGAAPCPGHNGAKAVRNAGNERVADASDHRSPIPARKPRPSVSGYSNFAVDFHGGPL